MKELESHLAQRDSCRQTFSTLNPATSSVNLLTVRNNDGSIKWDFTNPLKYGEALIERVSLVISNSDENKNIKSVDVNILFGKTTTGNEVQKSFSFIMDLNYITNQVEECNTQTTVTSVRTFCSMIGGTYNDGTLRCDLPAADIPPSGMVSAFNLNTCPSGWSLADGSPGTIPDLRGRYIRGQNIGVAINSTRDQLNLGLRSTASSAYPVHYHRFYPIYNNYCDSSEDNGSSQQSTFCRQSGRRTNHPYTSYPNTIYSASHSPETIYPETSPLTVNLLYCIKD